MQGAVQYCTLKKLTKQCLYEKVNKYLVLTSDRVEILALKVYEVKTFFLMFYLVLEFLVRVAFISTLIFWDWGLASS